MPLPKSMDVPPSPVNRPFAAGILNWSRYQPKSFQQLLNLGYCVITFLGVLVVVLTLDLCRCWVVTFGVVVVVVVESHRWAARFKARNFRIPSAPISVIPFTTIWLLAYAIPMFAYVFGGLAIWTCSLISVATIATLSFGKRLTRHYFVYAINHHHVSYDAREKWQMAMNDATKNGVCKPSNALTDAQLASFQYHKTMLLHPGFSTEAVCVAVLGTIFYFASLSNEITFYDSRQLLDHLGPLLVAFAAPLILLMLQCALLLDSNSFCFPLKLTFLALQNWLYSPGELDEQHFSPWSAQSPFSHPKERRIAFYWTLWIVTATLIPAVVISPFLNDTDSVYFRFFPNTDEPSYPLIGGYALLPDFSFWSVRWFAIVSGVLLAVPAFFMTLLTVFFGPSIQACHRLFEDPDALEHERIEPDEELARYLK